MNIFKLSIKNIQAKPLSATLNICLFATGIFIISLLLMTKEQFQSQLEKNIAGVDLVVGAKGSPLQIILSSIYHIDYPTGNISFEEANTLSNHPLVKHTIPLSFGDSYADFRIVGTNKDYSDLYHGKIKEGTYGTADFEVNIGCKVAKKANLHIGDEFAGIHGFSTIEGHSHDEFKYKVTGIFEETGTVLDQLILTNLNSVWEIHGSHHSDENEEHHHDETCNHQHNESCEHHHDEASEDTNNSKKEITTLLVFYRNPMGAMSLPRHINSNTNMQAAVPAMELNRLYSLMETSIKTISLIAYLIMLISAFSIFISLYNSMKERKYELALLRVMGGNKSKVFLTVIYEGLIISFIGYLIGIVLSHIGMFVVAGYTENSFHYSLNILGEMKYNLYLLILSLLIGFIVSVTPAIKAMNSDISKTLSK